MAKPKERRSARRLSVHHLVKYHTLSEADSGQKILISAKDISSGGACLLVSDNLPVYTIIKVYILIPHFEKPVPALAKICWKKYLEKIKKYKIGIQFIDIDDNLRQGIAKKIDFVYEKTKGAHEK